MITLKKCYGATTEHIQAQPKTFHILRMDKYASVAFAFQYVLATTTTTMLPSKRIYQYILSCSTEHSRNHIREFPFFESGHFTDYIEVMRSNFRPIPVQGHVFYSFSLCQQDGYCNQIRTKTNYDSKVHQNIHK